MKVLMDKITPPPASSGQETAQQGAEQLDTSFFASMMNMFTNLVKPEIPEDQVVGDQFLIGEAVAVEEAAANDVVSKDAASNDAVSNEQIEQLGELFKFVQNNKKNLDEPDLSHLEDLLYKVHEGAEDLKELNLSDSKIANLVKEMSNQNQVSQLPEDQQSKLDQLVRDNIKTNQQQVNQPLVSDKEQAKLNIEATLPNQIKTINKDFIKQDRPVIKESMVTQAIQTTDDLELDQLNKSMTQWLQKMEQPIARENVTPHQVISHVATDVIPTPKLNTNINLAVPKMAEQFGENVQMRVDQIEKMTSTGNVKDFHIKFHVSPEELGPVSAKLAINHNKAELVLSVNNDRIAELVKSQLHELKDQLKQMNIDLDSVDVQKRGAGSSNEQSDQNENARFELLTSEEESQPGVGKNISKKSSALVDKYI